MSGIFGLFQLDGAPIDPADVPKMMAAMDQWGPDGRSHHIAGPVAFGHLLLHNTPQAHHEHLPRQTASGLLLTTTRGTSDADTPRHGSNAASNANVSQGFRASGAITPSTVIIVVPERAIVQRAAKASASRSI